MNDRLFSSPVPGMVQDRPIRSFVRRQGRITAAQARALETLWPLYGIAPDTPFSPSLLFGREAPTILEIGFGDGETLAQMAEHRPDLNFLGIEVHPPGVGHLLLRVEEKELRNVRIYQADAVEILRERVADSALAGIHVFFPDPWPKSRHHKRRLINPEFLTLAAQKLAAGAILHAATDWEDYAQEMLAALEACPELANREESGGFAARPGNRPQTKFERRGLRLGHGVYDLIFERR